VRGPFNVNSLAQVGAIAALEDDEHYQQTMTMTREGIAWLTPRLASLGVKPLPTHTNFFLVDLGREAKPFYQAMLHKGVIIRPMTAYGLPAFIRITVGTPAENERLLKAVAVTLGELK
jgi:histidinol-phosphate aminotransferase